MYIFRFLHQTTTSFIFFKYCYSCISFVFYIKPQPVNAIFACACVVYLSFSTSNHNPVVVSSRVILVVYLSFSTSNHNLQWNYHVSFGLYIFRFLHQTTTPTLFDTFLYLLYIFRFLHQTTTGERLARFTAKLYIFRFLHQTTT